MIIGAGTAGLIAAKRISRFGISTIVYDQKKVPGTPNRASGILSIKGLDALEIGYKKAVTNTLYGARIHTGKETLEIIANKPKAHVLDRKVLNEICMYEAIDNGAIVNTGVRADHDIVGDYDILVGADGAVSSVAMHFNMGSIKRYVNTYKAEFEVNVDDAKSVDIIFNSRIANGLFGWMCPNSKEVLEVGIGTIGGNSKRAFDMFVKDKRVSDVIGRGKVIAEGASMIPLSLREKIVNGEKKVMLVGDAAGQVKPSTGGGIIFGGNAAIILADVIKKHFESGMPLYEYSRIYSSRYGLDTRIHNTVSAMYSKLDKVGFSMAIKVVKLLGIEKFLAKYGDMDMPSNSIGMLFSEVWPHGNKTW